MVYDEFIKMYNGYNYILASSDMHKDVDEIVLSLFIYDPDITIKVEDNLKNCFKNNFLISGVIDVVDFKIKNLMFAFFDIHNVIIMDNGYISFDTIHIDKSNFIKDCVLNGDIFI